ncbi:enoyl-CoA hydratase/isomerase family protein [Glaciibacter superstes]|uniref:enoyl-CoA hydratase/isomerase family protein n=1 Tax=Glaciibacter superstes TaxID=501023 RepID=UPI0003B451F1|nr:enoyl-CoA hydratase-related protein [Glaciibacter superstes]
MIRTDRRGAVAIVIIDRPERRNALDADHDAALAAAILAAAADPAVRAIVLAAEGSTFCSGADLRDRLPAYQERVTSGESPEWSFGGITGSERISVPIIAAINGPAIAGGLELALACDIRICAPEATFVMAEVRWGITPGAGGTQRLPRIIGSGAALDLLLTARPMSADEAYHVGLVSRVVPAENLLDEAISIAVAIADNAPLAVSAVRVAVTDGAALSIPEALGLERDLFLDTMRTADAREGSKAFAEKRTPIYEGV